MRLIHGGTVVEADIFRDLGGCTVELVRCISNLVPVSAYLRRVRGDSSLLLSVSRLIFVVLVEGETLEIDSEEMESAFNLFRMVPVWNSFLAFASSPLFSVP